MKPLSQVDMLEATRLTREGRLAEAMTVLRGAIRGSTDAATPFGTSDARQPPPDPAAHEFVDLVPPSAATGDAWTSPPSRQAPSDDHSPDEKPSRDAGGGYRGNGEQPNILPDLLTPIQSLRRPGIVAPKGSRFEERTYTNEAGSRRYKLYIPSCFGGQALPLVLMLHGCTQSPDDFAAGTRMNDLAEEFGLLVAYPAQAQSANSSRCWNWFRPGDQMRDMGEPSLIAGITQQIMKDYPVVPSKTFVAGLSAGGAAAVIMGAIYPDIFAAVAVHSGLACGAASDIPSAFTAMKQGNVQTVVRSRSRSGTSKPVPTIVFHGDRDITVSAVNGDQVIAQARGAAQLQRTITCGSAPGGIKFTRTVEKDQSGRTILEHWAIHGGGHAWSGGSTDGSFTDPRGPNASREIIRFFYELSNG